ncbi:hypothetical protein EJB05_18170 [Eragrostis curvula]|uniref:Myb/SANT-like domain-containing protein n=1 Tax=Eragrostis curvula TaxID=38414 RepID=A0A5J9VJ82_9POAL|nr:hypothetical protein EJB05_18158 [Eragrostis curvula]TVU36245.1 hypothetical protein EJB05_18170 [Eragrostis curvula]
MASIRSLLSSPFAAGFPSHRRLTVSRGRGAPGIGGNARPVFSAGRGSIAVASLPRFRTDSKGSGPVEPNLNEDETKVSVRSSQTSSKRFKWSKERTNFLTRYLMQQASDAKGKDAVFREDALLEAAEAVSQRFQRDCSVADVQRRLATLREKWRSIERIKGHASASWNHATRTVHPTDSGFINRPIAGYDELAFLLSNEKSPDHTQAEKDQTAHFVNNQISEDPMEQKINNEDIRYLVLKIGELIDALKDLKPRDFANELWKAVTACGYNERMAITAFEYFLKNEVEGKIFLVRSPDLRKEWLAKFFSSLM